MLMQVFRMTQAIASTSQNSEPGRCIFCGGAVQLILEDCRDYYLATPFRVNYGCCASCGLVQQSPIPRDVAPFYAAYPMHKRRGPLHQKLRKFLRSPIYYRPRRGEAIRLLDYGCGDGGYLESIAAAGRERFGYEVDANLAARVADRSGITVYSDREQMLAAVAGTLDVVTAHFVFEHLTDLRDGFATVAKLLKPGGIFYCVVPQYDSTEARLFGRRWHGLDPPRHISFPSPELMQKLGDEAGLLLREHQPVPFANGFAGSLATVPTGRFNMPLFLMLLPIGSIFARLFPGGARAFTFGRMLAGASAGR
jgi:SAM-dependent methyltransferase